MEGRNYKGNMDIGRIQQLPNSGGVEPHLQFDPKYELASMIDQSSASYESAKILCGAHVAKILFWPKEAPERSRSLPLPLTLCKISRAESFSGLHYSDYLWSLWFFVNMTQSTPTGVSGNPTDQIAQDLGLNNPEAQAAAVAPVNHLEARRKAKEDKIVRDIAKKSRNDAKETRWHAGTPFSGFAPLQTAHPTWQNPIAIRPTNAGRCAEPNRVAKRWTIPILDWVARQY
jgi:hypothetical protein